MLNLKVSGQTFLIFIVVSLVLLSVGFCYHVIRFFINRREKRKHCKKILTSKLVNALSLAVIMVPLVQRAVQSTCLEKKKHTYMIFFLLFFRIDTSKQQKTKTVGTSYYQLTTIQCVTLARLCIVLTAIQKSALKGEEEKEKREGGVGGGLFVFLLTHTIFFKKRHAFLVFRTRLSKSNETTIKERLYNVCYMLLCSDILFLVYCSVPYFTPSTIDPTILQMAPQKKTLYIWLLLFFFFHTKKKKKFLTILSSSPPISSFFFFFWVHL
ncbi:hypothetical protein RFI_11524 [Reticulomyxa filosa]|uniref:Uncharacterized protein n=1 Tax=Reticulomyxa filosa TaxID=46433 RepID=X6NH15_RETFI|nr:hypothetical protein RFI_11524 [Reticulomyxa filosa]|eukprot:ETO25610.1 hypothetical protein RFI_11524 [Reticulomyxa filosa]